MTQIDFQDRLNRLDARDAPVERPAQPKARNRRERLQIAQAHMTQAGVPMKDAFPPALQALAKVGLIVKPFYFWGFTSLAIFMMCLFTVLSGFVLYMGTILGSLPRFAHAMLDGGPMVFLMVTSVVGVVFAAIIKSKAAQFGLPRWGDL